MAELLFDDLLSRYAEPHRHYHDTRHLAEVMAVVDELEEHAEDVEMVRLAAWFHDAVYDPTRTDNEERSAELAAEYLLAMGLPDAQTSEVVRLVRLTASHEPVEGDRNGELLCDADLAILGADPQRYLDYADGVRQEYAHLDDEAFAGGRAEVLQGLLDRPLLFHTPQGQARWENTARANVSGELAQLRRTAG